MPRQASWPRIFAEGVAIVVSILLAFAIQAWWEGRGEAERRAALLAGLSSDLDGAAEDLQRVLQRHEAGLDAAERLVRMARGDSLSPADIPLVDSLLSNLFAAPSYDPPMGTLQALISSGELHILGNAELAGALTAWPALVEDLLQDEQENLILVRDYFAPFLRAHGINTNDLIWDVAPESRPWEPSRTDAYLLLADPEFEGILGDRVFEYRSTVEEAQAVRAAIDRIRVLMSNEPN